MQGIWEINGEETGQEGTVAFAGGHEVRKAREGLSFVYNTLQRALGEGFNSFRCDLACTGGSLPEGVRVRVHRWLQLECVKDVLGKTAWLSPLRPITSLRP